jgi:hypothetical protein
VTQKLSLGMHVTYIVNREDNKGVHFSFLCLIE